jgi:hypothetical protein
MGLARPAPPQWFWPTVRPPEAGRIRAGPARAGPALLVSAQRNAGTSPRPESNWGTRASDARRQYPLPGRSPGRSRVGEAGVEPAQPKRPDYSRVFSPHDQLALGVPDGYCPRSRPGHSRAPRFLGPGTGRPGRCRTCCLRHVKAALYPDELQAVRAPGRTRTSTTGSVIRHDLRFTTGAGPAVVTGLEPATSTLTGWRANHLLHTTMAPVAGIEPASTG